METTWSEIQTKRLTALDADQTQLSERFEDKTQRDRTFLKLEGALAKMRKKELEEMRRVHGRPGLCRLETKLVETLVGEGFVQVTTPTILSRGLLARMGVTEAHDLFTQIFWLDRDRCLRPMLAPHLYYVIKDLLRLWEKPASSRSAPVSARIPKEHGTPTSSPCSTSASSVFLRKIEVGGSGRWQIL